jgi:hypothetical protein
MCGLVYVKKLMQWKMWRGLQVSVGVFNLLFRCALSSSGHRWGWKVHILNLDMYLYVINHHRSSSHIWCTHILHICLCRVFMSSFSKVTWSQKNSSIVVKHHIHYNGKIPWFWKKYNLGWVDLNCTHWVHFRSTPPKLPLNWETRNLPK